MHGVASVLSIRGQQKIILITIIKRNVRKRRGGRCNKAKSRSHHLDLLKRARARLPEARRRGHTMAHLVVLFCLGCLVIPLVGRFMANSIAIAIAISIQI